MLLVPRKVRFRSVAVWPLLVGLAHRDVLVRVALMVGAASLIPPGRNYLVHAAAIGAAGPRQ